MDLQEILKKTKQKSEKLNTSRRPPVIADDDRPYINKTEDKLETNRRQTEDKTAPKLETKRRQTEDNFKNRKKTGDKVESKLETELETKWRQTEDKVETNLTFFSLVGNERKIVFYLYNCCKITRDKMTMPLSIENIAHACEINKKSIKKTLQRLTIKGIVIRSKYKNGRAGWTQYELDKSIYNDILQHENNIKLATNWRQTSDKLESKLGTKLETNPSSSSSLNNNKNTTTTDFSPEWLKIDLEPLSDIGFTQTHLLQIAAQEKLTPHVVQASINAFAYDLQYNNKRAKIKGAPLDYFMGILRNGRLYAPPDNYESPEDMVLRQYIEQQQQLEQKRAALENTALEFAFRDWLPTLSDEDKTQLLGNLKRFTHEAARMSVLKEHFKTTVWPHKRQALVQLSDNKPPDKL